MTDSADGPTLRVSVAGAADRDSLDAVRDRAERTAVVETGSTGAPSGPYAYVTVDGRTALYAAVTDSTLERLVDACEEGSLPTAEAEAVTDGDGPPRPTEGPLSVGTRRVLEGCGWHAPTASPDPVAPEVRADPERAFETVEEIGLLGRGRADAAADEPLAESWGRIRETDGDPVLVVNAADADPEAHADRLLCASAAGRLYDAADAVAAVVGAEDVIVLAPAEDPLVVERLEAAGEWHVVAAEDDFRLGEPTMALERLEGNDRIEARRRPPGPEEWGLYGRPTAVHTPRTLLQAAEFWRNPEAFDADTADPGTRLVSVGGDVAAPTTIELPTDVPLSRALSAVDSPANARFAVGGRFGGLTRSLDVPVAAPALSAAGLGTEGVVEVLGPDRCIVASVGERAAFAREENCGRCVPCREGSKQLHEALRAVYDGEFDAGEIRELSRVMATTSLCTFGETAARPVRTALEDFEGEFRAHADGRCPAGACGGMQ
ncbi:NADH-ubiquinone oxidoreductase-F iron-sulfur binding region domain-containing protein [Natronomonas gomsonensis]|uniref:NADH-ubiquinone oxidoreductase-F iron-sulfur binding region domain-containing protein n=1 Tax=Natronomonas gomsonensis TaxID=1046043 RepID=UPI0015BE9059|nr:NADH-ubiquinone oxidoreductase-F iron-sulfur binding region domain-containing protein [Natronomonas gomsonensis]